MAEKRAVEVGFLYLGGAHQVLHSAPVAAVLSTDEAFRVVCLVATDAERAVVEQVVRAWPEARIRVEALPAPRWAKWLPRPYPARAPLKLPRLLHNRRRLAQLDAVVTTERTSTLLRRLGWSPAKLIHIPHGAGDRARGFEPRLRLFDYVIVSGPKDAARMVGSGLVARENCAVSGSVKLAAISRLRPARPRLFANDRPVVLYNPHFSATLGSWERWGLGVIAAFAQQEEFNLIVAPHVRLFSGRSEAEKNAVRSLAIPDRIIVDTGSERCNDMSYTQAADIFLGDVSSQIYEFLSRPRPCVFLNAMHADWRDNPDYASWRYGEVVDDFAEVLSAVRRARQKHAEFLPLQRDGVAAALGTDWAAAPERAAGLIRDFLLKRRPATHTDLAGQPARGALLADKTPVET